MKFRPNARIVAHHGNVKDPEFGVDFFKQFTVVLSGLDNLEARRHVNRLCLAAEIPLIESGTTGYNGQVWFHEILLGLNLGEKGGGDNGGGKEQMRVGREWKEGNVRGK